MKRLFKNLFRGRKSMAKARKGGARLGLEALEGRELMAASIVNGVLTVTGTNPGDFVPTSRLRGVFASGHDLITINHNPQDLFGSTGVMVGITDTMGTPGQNDDVVLETRFFNYGHLGDGSGGFSSIRVDGLAGNDVILNNLTNPSDFLFGPGFPQFDRPDELIGGRGNDVLFGGRRETTLIGDGFADWSQHGSDTLIGGMGNDTYVFEGNNADTFDKIGEVANADSDSLDFSGCFDPLRLDLAGAAQPVQEVSVRFFLSVSASGFDINTWSGTAIENVRGTNLWGDTIRGNGRDNRLEGGLGDDVLEGRGGSDTYVYSGPARNLGRDTVDERDSALGTDTLDFSGYQEGINLDLMKTNTDHQIASQLYLILTDDRGIENVVGTNFKDVIRGNKLNNVLDGREGSDSLFGLVGSDTLLGGGGDDRLGGNFFIGSQWMDDTEDDVMDGGEGHDTLCGGSGHDTLKGGRGRDVLWGDSGNDRLYAGMDSDGYPDGYVDDLHGSDGDDRFYELDSYWLSFVKDTTDQTGDERWNQFWEQ
jgi:Ca2+-binding RTX toxin-like protein